MRKNKSLFRQTLTVLLLSLIVLAAGTACAAEKDDRELIIGAYRQMQAFDNYHMTIDMTMTMKISGAEMNTVVKGESDVAVKPLLVKTAINVDINTPDGKKSSQQSEQYIEDSGDALVMYNNINGNWKKQLLPKGSYDPLQEYERYIAGIKSVERLVEDDETITFAVVIGSVYFKDSMKRQLATMGMAKIELSDEVFTQLGDCKYQMIINKNNGNIAQINMDLSDLIAKIGGSLVEKTPEAAEKKELMREMFKTMKLSTQIKFMQFDAVNSFMIPNEVKKTAVLLSLPQQK